MIPCVRFRGILLASLAFVSTGSLYGQNVFGTVTPIPQVQSILADVSLDSLQYFVKTLSGALPANYAGTPVTFSHRYAGSGGSVLFRMSADYIYSILARYGLNPVYENNPYLGSYDRINVVGTLPGASGEYVIVCGHFDSANLTCPGADDNASGTAALLEAARVLRNHSFSYGIKFIAFGGEEQGLRGSARYVVDHAPDAIRAVLNCDMIMWDDDADKVVQIHRRYKAASMDLADYVCSVNTAYSLPGQCMKVDSGTTASDHASFWNATPPRSAVLFIEEQRAPPDFNLYYHTANDTWSSASAAKHQDFFSAVSKLAIASAAHLADIVSPVPVELASFSGILRNGIARLSWTTITEKNSHGFAVQRSTDTDRPAAEARWTTVGFVPGSGTSSTTHRYEFPDTLDTEALGGSLLLYRLKLIDRDGSHCYSHVIGIPVAMPVGDLAVRPAYPNPATANTTVPILLSSAQAVTVEVYTTLGERVLLPVENVPFPPGFHRITIPSASLPAGLYFCRINTPTASTSKPFVKLAR